MASGADRPPFCEDEPTTETPASFEPASFEPIEAFGEAKKGKEWEPRFREIPFTFLIASPRTARLKVTLEGLDGRQDNECWLGSLRDAIEDLIDKLPEPWNLAFAELLPGTHTLPEADGPRPAQLAKRLEIFGWRLLLVAGQAFEAPWPPLLDRCGRLSTRDLTLLWSRIAIASETAYFNLRVVQTRLDGSNEPVVRALWRVTTGAAVDRLDETHRRALGRVKRPVDVLRLAVEEARVLEETGRRDDALADLEELLRDPILRRDREDLAFALLGRVHLYRASLAGRHGRIAEAREHLGEWERIRAAVEKDQVAEAELVHAGLDLAEVEEGSERVTWTMERISHLVANTQRESQARVFALSIVPSLRSGHYGEAVELLVESRSIHLGGRRPAPQAHVDLVSQLAEARWCFCVHDLCEAGLFAESGDEGAENLVVDRVAKEQRPRLCLLREELAEAAPAFLALLSPESPGVYRWYLGRSWALENPYRAVELMVQAIDDLFTATLECPLHEIARDLTVTLRHLGLSRDDLLGTEEMDRLFEIDSEVRTFVEEILDGRRHALYGPVTLPSEPNDSTNGGNSGWATAQGVSRAEPPESIPVPSSDIETTH